jgi:hypothetical protein
MNNGLINFLLGFMNDSTPQDITFSGTIIREQQIKKDMEGSGCVLIRDTIPAFACRDYENHENLSQDSQFLSLCSGISKYKAGLLPT